ncbi:hypothetical protein [Sphingobacterium corticibacter]|uniref:Uncharacterized protein n=1 Tax=Sphingobacterium corticibacter TaxID=2171749 RepID=A0A2T8HNZ7_9SPHI|nr:hypothetical protein [Sphingobacterium corticibacter]PVH27032.1 hypothetical protein DC487_05395 [Sphingobacterium corticibacter]
MREASHMQKGEVKVTQGSKVYPTRVHDPKKQRKVHIPFMSMCVYVKINDPRTDDEIKRAWAERKAKEDKSFTSPYLAKPVKGKGGSDNDY